MSSASLGEMNELHSMIAQTLKKQIKDGVVVQDKEGNVVQLSTPAAILNVARQFLRDNNIECNGSLNPDVKALTEELPFEPQESARVN